MCAVTKGLSPFKSLSLFSTKAVQFSRMFIPLIANSLKTGTVYSFISSAPNTVPPTIVSARQICKEREEKGKGTGKFPTVK